MINEVLNYAINRSFWFLSKVHHLALFHTCVLKSSIFLFPAISGLLANHVFYEYVRSIMFWSYNLGSSEYILGLMTLSILNSDLYFLRSKVLLIEPSTGCPYFRCWVRILDLTRLWSLRFIYLQRLTVEMRGFRWSCRLSLVLMFLND